MADNKTIEEARSLFSEVIAERDRLREAAEALVLAFERPKGDDYLDECQRALDRLRAELRDEGRVKRESQREAGHANRWWTTFNAVLPVYIAGGADHDAHVHAAEVANNVHGPRSGV